VLDRVKFVNSVNNLRDHYINQFKNYFGETPVVESEDDIHLRWAVDKFGIERARDLISAYFTVEDDWYRKQAYPISIFRKQINKVIANGVKNHKIKQPLYQVAITENGTPVHSPDKESCRIIAHAEGGQLTRNNFTPKLVTE